MHQPPCIDKRYGSTQQTSRPASCLKLLYHFDQVFSHITVKKSGCFKIRLNSKDNSSAFSETEFSKIVNTWSKWYSTMRRDADRVTWLTLPPAKGATDTSLIKHTFNLHNLHNIMLSIETRMTAVNG